MFIVSTAQYTFINYLPRTRLGEKLPDRLIPSFSIECQKSFPCTKFDLCKYLAQDYFIAVKMKNSEVSFFRKKVNSNFFPVLYV